MATYRYISTYFWDDEWIQTLDPSEKLLYLYLMTNPLTNIAGVYQITVRRMCFDTGFNSDTVGHILSKFEKAKKVFYHKGWIILPTWPKHQKYESRSKIKTGIDAVLKYLPEEILKYMVSIGYAYPIDTVSIPYTYLPNYSDSDSDSDLDSDSDSDLDKDCPPAIKTTAELNKPKNNQKFVKPTLEEVSAYCQERSNGIDPQAFLDFYEAKGWRIGKEPMRDWKAAVRTWERRQMSEGKPLRIFTQTASFDIPEA